MNSDTGQLMTLTEMERLDLSTQELCLPIDEQLMTLRQRQENQVSKFDNRSPLGRIRIQHRNSIRNKPCPCGSGIKFKRCCYKRTKGLTG